MATMRARHGVLVVDFRYHNIRCREKTNLTDTPANRKTLAKIIEKMEAEITLGIFDYGAYFPKSDKIEKMKQLDDRVEACVSRKPTFKDFAKTWFGEKQVEWQPAYQQKIQIILDNYLIPFFGQKTLPSIKKSDLLDFRSSLAKVRYGKDNQTSLSVARINQIMIPLRMILQEGSDRYEFDTPFKGIKNLK